MSKYSGITEHNKAAFDAILPVVKDNIDKIGIPGGQATTTVIQTNVVNINGYDLNARYGFNSTLVSGAYPYYKIKKDNIVEMTMEDVKLYFSHMTGSAFIPMYNKDYPQTSMWISASGEVLKPQVEPGTNNTSKFVIKLYIMPMSLGGIKLYYHDISITHSMGGRNVLLITTSKEKIELDNLTPIYQNPINSFLMTLDVSTRLAKTANQENLTYITYEIDSNGFVKGITHDDLVLANITAFNDNVSEL